MTTFQGLPPVEVQPLLVRIDAYLKAEQEAGGRGRTYHPMHPATLLADAYAKILELNARTDAALRLLASQDGVTHVPRAHPTGATQAALQDAREGRTERFDTVDALFTDLNAADEK